MALSDAMSRAAFSLMSPAGARGRLSILIFHRVLAQPDDIFTGEVDAARFDTLLGWIKDWATVLPLDEAAQRLRSRSLPARALSITFDDGYADNAEVALPLLQKHGLTACFFIATGFLGAGRMWNDQVIEALRRAPAGALELGSLGRYDLSDASSRRHAIEALLGEIKYRPLAQRLALAREIEARCGGPQGAHLMLGDAGVRRLHSAGMQIGAHTVSHPILATLTEAQCRQEIGDSKRYLEDLLRVPVPLFAYPNGKPDRDYNATAVRVVQELGFEAAVSTRWAAARSGDECFELPRFSPWDQSCGAYRARLLGNLWR